MSNFEDAPREINRNFNSVNATDSTLTGANMIKKTHPAIIIAAVAVTIFSAIGAGVLTGIIPSAGALSGKDTAPTQSGLPPALTVAGAAQVPLGSLVEDDPTSSTVTKPTPMLKPIEKPNLGQPLARNEPRADSQISNTRKPANINTPVPTYQPNPGSATEHPQVLASNSSANTSSPLVSPVCSNCGTVDSVTANAVAGQGSGAGAVLGGVLGGVLGNQVGGGRGRDVATVAGAVGGAVLGNTIEKNTKASTTYSIRLRMEDGTFQTVKSDTDQGMRIGDRVKIENQRLIRN